MLAPSFILPLLIYAFACYFGENLLKILFDHLNILQTTSSDKADDDLGTRKNTKRISLEIIIKHCYNTCSDL